MRLIYSSTCTLIPDIYSYVKVLQRLVTIEEYKMAFWAYKIKGENIFQ